MSIDLYNRISEFFFGPSQFLEYYLVNQPEFAYVFDVIWIPVVTPEIILTKILFVMEQF